MDLGIDRLVEMFEERFGRRAGTAILALIGLAVVGLTLKTIYETMLLPLANVIASTWMSVSAMKTISLPSPTEIIAQAAIVILSVGLFVLSVRKLVGIRRRIDSSFRALHARLAALEYDKRTTEQERDALRHLLNRAGGSPGLQPPQDTEKGT